MSIDPAAQRRSVPQGTLALAEVPLDKTAAYVFDFDGVLCDAVEDKIYNLPSWPGETALLAALAEKMGLRCHGMEPRYRRHLLYQAAAYLLQIDSTPGPGWPLFEKLAHTARVFILTARSGWYAEARVRRFLEQRGTVPVEMFHVGRVKKERQIDLVCRELAPDMVYYIEDNPAHLAAVAALDLPNLRFVLAPRHEKADEAALLQRRVEALLTEALEKPFYGPHLRETKENASHGI